MFSTKLEAVSAGTKRKPKMSPEELSMTFADQMVSSISRRHKQVKLVNLRDTLRMFWNLLTKYWTFWPM